MRADIPARCSAPITWETMEWSHKKHGQGFRDDSMDGGIASCRDCHRRLHSSQGIPRRPGKVMNITKAKEYWNGTECFCGFQNKKQKESFCPDCRAKLAPQTLHDLENADDPDVYREVLARAELEVLMYGKGEESGA